MQQLYCSNGPSRQCGAALATGRQVDQSHSRLTHVDIVEGKAGGQSGERGGFLTIEYFL